MAEGTNVGSIYLDLVVRNTVEKQMQEIASQGQATAQKAFSGMEKAAQSMANSVSTSADRTMQKTADAISRGFNKSVATAQARVRELEREYERISARAADVRWSYNYNEDGDKATDRLAERLTLQQEAAYERLIAARERLTIAEQAAAQKTAAAAESAALKQQMAAQKAAERAAAAAQRSAAKRETEEKRAAAAAEKAAQKTAAAEEKAANRRKAIHASMWKNMLSHAGSAAKSIGEKLAGIAKRFTTAGKTASRFGSRLREIASGALIFNGISAVLRKVTSYLGETISSTGQMKTALANLKGAAATAAQPIVEALTPALTALTNAAATAFSYLSRLISYFTGKSLSSMASAAKKVQTSANTAKKAMASLAGFDEIQKLDGNSDSSSDDGTVEPNYAYQGKSTFLDSLIESVKTGNWGQIGTLIALKLNESLEAIPWDSIQQKIRSGAQALADVVNGFVSNLDFGVVGRSIAQGLNTITTGVDAFFQGINWEELGAGLGTGLSNLFDTINWASLGKTLTDKFKALFETLHGFVSTFNFEDLGSNLAEMFTAGLGNINWVQLVGDISAGVVGLLTAGITFIRGLDWKEVGSTIADCLANIDWDGILLGILGLIGSGLEGLYNLAAGLFEGLAESCGNGFFGGMFQAFADIYNWIKEHIVTPLVDGICSLLGIHSPSTVFAEIGGNLIKGLLNGIKEVWSQITSFFDTALSSISTKVTSAFKNLKAAVFDIWKNGILPAIKGPINSIISCINGMISGIVTGINSVIRTLNRLQFDIPDWVPVLGGNSFGFNLQTVSAPRIPLLADGGVITQPTLAMMGEYSGARSNPEIVAPQSIMEETVANVMREWVEKNQESLETVIGILRDILEAILGIEIGDDTIAQAVARYNAKMAVVKGG